MKICCQGYVVVSEHRYVLRDPQLAVLYGADYSESRQVAHGEDGCRERIIREYVLRRLVSCFLSGAYLPQFEVAGRMTVLDGTPHSRQPLLHIRGFVGAGKIYQLSSPHIYEILHADVAAGKVVYRYGVYVHVLR